MKKIKKLTEKQKKLIQLLSVNIGLKKPKSIYGMLLEAGYSESIAKQQSSILNTEGVKRELKPIVSQLEAKRQIAIDALTDEKINNSLARDITAIIDVLTKNSQLLGGGATESARMTITFDDSFKPKTKPLKANE